MFKSETIIRVRYAETDQMGFVYYGNYAQYYEVARVEALRNIGISYKSLEESGIMMPVVQMNINYKKPAYYDDILRIVTNIKFIPPLKMEFLYEIYNSNNILINNGETILVFVSKETMKPCQCPLWFIDILEKQPI
jgi:acyl-CoA thioester hydrolase